MRAPALVGIVTALHIVGITALVLIQGCGTTRAYRPDTGSVPPAPMPVTPPAVGPTAPAVTQGRIPAATVTPAAQPATREGTKYTVQRGDILSAIAQRHGVNTRDLAQYNDLANPNALRVGQVLTIPPYAETPAVQPRSTTPSVAGATTAAASGEYVVQAGDTLSGIAARHGTSVAALKAANNLTSDMIRPGQKLALSGSGGSPSGIPPPRTPTTEGAGGIEMIKVPDDAAAPDVSVPAVDTNRPPATGTTDGVMSYTVMEGDTIEEITRLFIVSKEEILELNNLAPNAALVPGTTIKIPPSSL
jgi:LysM repeat protein